MKIVALAGSLREESATHQAVTIVGNAAEAEGAEVEFFDLRLTPLPFYDAREKEETYPEVVHLFKEKMYQADGFIFGSPEYHGSISGILKNAIDFLGVRQLEGKPVALVGVAGGALGATNTLNTLNVICRNLHAWPLPMAPSIPQSYAAFESAMILHDKGLQGRLEELGQSLVHTIQLFSNRKTN